MKRCLCSLVLALLAAPLLAVAAPPPTSGRSGAIEVRFLSFSPSPYTRRHDSTRAGLGTYLLLEALVREHRLPLRVSFYDGASRLDDASELAALTGNAKVLVIGGSTWGQGSARFLRQFFEVAGAGDWTGQRVTAWGTAGGAHTGGDVMVADTLRSALGMGAQVFTLGQKYMVFTTDERTGIEDGHFSLLDVWFMDQFARVIAVNALGDDPADARALADRLGVGPHYYRTLPKEESALLQFEGLASKLNAAADPRSPQWRELSELVK